MQWSSVAGAEGFFVSDGEESAYSGIYVFHPNATNLAINVGDVVPLFTWSELLD